MGYTIGDKLPIVPATDEHKGGAIGVGVVPALDTPLKKIGSHNSGNGRYVRNGRDDLIGGDKEPLKKEFNWQSIIPTWSSWGKLPKTDDGRYGLLAGRKYTPHAIKQMYPMDLGVPHGEKEDSVAKGYNAKPHGVAPRFVEDAIRNGVAEDAEWNSEHQEWRVMYVHGDLRVVTSCDGQIVVSVYTCE